ncbi:Cysteine synthase mitochondrial [Zea mays]
MQPEP